MNRPQINLTYGEALEAVKQDRLIARAGWNGKGMFVFMRPEDTLSADMIINKVKSLPQAFKDTLNSHVQAGTVPADQVFVKFTAYLCMKAADGTIVNGWLASQTDMLAEDWMILA